MYIDKIPTQYTWEVIVHILKRYLIFFFSILVPLACIPHPSFAENHKLPRKLYYKTPEVATTSTYKMGTRRNYKGYKGEKPLPPASLPSIVSIILKEGPYIGIGGGYDSYKIHEKIPLNGGSTTSTYNPSINGTGLVGELLAGYGHYFNSVLYLGGEVFANISAVYQNGNIAISNSTDTISYNSKFIVTTGYGLGFLPGLKLNDAGLVFLRLGYHVARLRGQENRIINGASPIVNDTSSWSGGFGYGIGFEEAMLENFSLRGEYIHIDYRTFNASPSSGTQYSPSDNQFMLSLIYHLSF